MEAIEALQKAVDINPYFLGQSQHARRRLPQMGDYNKAIGANLKVIELEPDNVNGYNDLGGYLWTGRFDEAAGVFEKALKLLPNPETYTNLGVAYYYVGKFNEAVPQYEKAVELSPNDELVVGNLGDGYRMTGQIEKANATYDRAIALGLKHLRTNPKNALVRANVCLYYAKKGDAARGAKFLKDARD
jgi:tetratricopeptide (TPR) repeat protein